MFEGPIEDMIYADVLCQSAVLGPRLAVAETAPHQSAQSPQ